ncbi:motility associated factor glycosyltransferase family protein [Limisalsivibrio acetivorans]|uniref:motility associated factor glycosyltransferase family protein n=1 Tax=Limisalsivibrio acetivorans TaxID=1304888 RepID=UPI0003B5F7BC|nr:6-hydroxymethylpterin diphosphokinase MptE-like protein [Limisalsivibrio acetivorans]
MIEKKNYRALKECRPELYQLMLKTKRSDRYKMINSAHPKKYPNLINLRTNTMFYENNDPVGASRKSIMDKKINVPQVSYFLGMGLLYNIFNYLDMYNFHDCTYIVIEKDAELFHHILEFIDIEQIIRDQRVHLIVGKDVSELYPVINGILFKGANKFYAKALNIIEEPAAFTAHREYYSGVMRTIRDAVREVVLFYGNDPLDSLIGIEHTFININEIIDNPGIKDLEGRFKGKPGIVVATGPSLNKNVHLLKGLEDKAVICSVDASMRVLKNHGLKPHMVTSLERVEATSRLFEEITEEDAEKVFLAAVPVVHPKTYENYPGERIVVYRNFATFHWLDIKKGILDIGPSSANMAFKVLEFLGCDPIILIGQDLAFGPDETTHAEGSTYGEKEEQYSKPDRTLTVEGNFVPEIKTSVVWNAFLKYYTKDVANYSGTVINATEGGAKIHGTKLMTFADAIDKHIKDQPSMDVYQMIKGDLEEITDELREEHRDITMERVDESIEYCEDVMHRFYEGYKIGDEYVEKVLKPYEDGEPYNMELGMSMLKELEKTMQIFNEQKFFNILMHYVQSYYIKSVIDIQGVRAGHEEQHIKNNKVMSILRDLFGVMVELIKKMLQLLHILKQILEITSGKNTEKDNDTDERTTTEN